MKCLILFVLYVASYFSNVYSLGLNVTMLAGYSAVVGWTLEDSDPVPLTFDLRFVIPPLLDVGLAIAAISATQPSGQVSVDFPNNGTFMLVAVTGPSNTQIGRTAFIEVPPITSTVPTPSQTTLPSPSQIPATPIPSPPTPPSPSKSIPATGPGLQKKPNVVLIVLGVFAGLAVTAMIILAISCGCKRRRPTEDPRISFYGDRMVQERPVPGGGGSVIMPYSFTGQGSTPRPSPRPSGDLEQGLAFPAPPMTSFPPNSSKPIKTITPLPSGYFVPPPPRGPRERSRTIVRPDSIATASSRYSGEITDRQRQLGDKITEVEARIERMKSLEPRPRPSTIVSLDDLELQKAWLLKHRESMWALEEVDTLPPGFSRYME